MRLLLGVLSPKLQENSKHTDRKPTIKVIKCSEQHCRLVMTLDLFQDSRAGAQHDFAWLR